MCFEYDGADEDDSDDDDTEDDDADDDDGDDDVASKFPRHLEVGGGAQRIVGGVATHTGEHTVTHTGATVWESTNLMLAILIAPLVIMMMMVTILVLQGQGA